LFETLVNVPVRHRILREEKCKTSTHKVCRKKVNGFLRPCRFRGKHRLPTLPGAAIVTDLPAIYLLPVKGIAFSRPLRKN
jgi:hypothetical protein